MLLFLNKDGHWWQQRNFITEDGLEQKCVKIDTKTARQWFMRSRPLKPRPTGGQNTSVITPETKNDDTNHNTVSGTWNKQTIYETKTTQEVSSDSGTCSNSSSSCLWSCTSSSSPSASSGSNSTDVSPQSQQEVEFEKRKRRSGYYHQHKDESSSSPVSQSASPSPVSPPRRIYSVADAGPNVAAILQIDADGNVGVIVADTNDKVNEKNVITGNEEFKSEENRESFSEPVNVAKTNDKVKEENVVTGNEEFRSEGNSGRFSEPNMGVIAAKTNDKVKEENVVSGNEEFRSEGNSGRFSEPNMAVIVAETNDKVKEENVVSGNEEFRSEGNRGSFLESNMGVIVAETNDKLNEKNVIIRNEELRSKDNRGSFSEPNIVISKEQNDTSSECSIDKHEDTSRNRHEALTIEEKRTTTCQEATLDDSTSSGHITISPPVAIPSEVKMSTHCVSASSHDIAPGVQAPINKLFEISMKNEHPVHLNITSDNTSSSVMRKGDQAELVDVFHPETDIFVINNGFNTHEIATSKTEMLDGVIEQKVSEVKTKVSREDDDCSQEPPTVEFCPEAFALFSSAEGFNDQSDHKLNTINLQDSPDKSRNSFVPDVSSVFSSGKITDALPPIENMTCTIPSVKSGEQDRTAIETPVKKLNMSISSNSTSSGWSPEYESGLSCTDDIEVVVIDLNNSLEIKKDATGTRDTKKETKAKLLASDTELVKNGQIDADAGGNDGGKSGEVCVKCEDDVDLQECFESEKVETKASCKNVRELPSCPEPESEKVDTKAMCEEVRKPNELFRNVTSTLTRNDSSAKRLESPGEVIGQEMQKKEGPKKIDEYQRLQMLSDKKNGMAEPFGDSHIKTDFNDKGKSSEKGPEKLKNPPMQAVLPEPVEKFKATVTRGKSSIQQGSYLKSKVAQVQPGLRQAKTTRIPQRKVFVNSLSTEKLQADERTKGILPGLTSQYKSLIPSRVNNTIQEKEKDKSSVAMAPESVVTKAKRLTCIVKPINCQLKPKVEVKQSDSLKGQVCSQKKEENRPVIRILKRETKQQVDTNVEDIKKVETVQSDQKQTKKHERELRQEEQFKKQEEMMSSRRDEKEMNYLNHHAKPDTNFEGNEKKQVKNNKTDESTIPIHNLAKLLQSASKIPESENIEQKSKLNLQIHNGNKVVPPSTELPKSSSAVSSQLIKCDKVAKVKPERAKQPSKHGKNDVTKDADETKTYKRGVNIQIPPQTTVPAIKTQQFVGKAGIYVMSKTKSGASGPRPLSVSKSSVIPPTTQTHQLRTQNSKAHATRPSLLKKENQIPKSPKQEPKLVDNIKKCSTKVQIPPAKIPPNSINKKKSTEKLQKSTTTNYKSSGNKINSSKNSLNITDNEKNETKSPSILQKILTRVWNFSTKFRKSSPDAEEQKSTVVAEEKFSTSIQKNTCKCLKEQDCLKLSRKLANEQLLIDMNKKSALDVVKCSPAPVENCKQPEKEDPGLVLPSSVREQQKDDRDLVQSTARQHGNGIDSFISNNNKTHSAIEQRREGISRVETGGRELKLQNNSELESCKTTVTSRHSVMCKTSRAAINTLNIKENESMNSLTTKLVEQKENNANGPKERTHTTKSNLLAQMLVDSSSSEPESSYTDSFETPDSSFEDIEGKNLSDSKKTGATEAKYKRELVQEMTDDLSVFTNQKEIYKATFRKKEINVKNRTQNELCPGMFHLGFDKTTAKISNVILCKSPGELKSIDAMYKGHLKFPTKLHCTSRKMERLAFLETEEGNYDVAMCSTYPLDREMKKKLNKVSGFVSQTYQMSFSGGEARRFPVMRFTDISATPKYMFSEIGKKKIQRIKYVLVKPDALPTEGHVTDKLEDKALLKREDQSVEVRNGNTVNRVCEDKSTEERKGSAEVLCTKEKKKNIEDMDPTNQQLCKYNNSIERETSNNVPRGPQKAAVIPCVTKQRKESKNCVDLKETDGRKTKANEQQEKEMSELCEQGARPKEQRATEPPGARQKTREENHGRGNKISSSADKVCSGASGRTSIAATTKRTPQIYSNIFFPFLSHQVVFKSKSKFINFTYFQNQGFSGQ